MGRSTWDDSPPFAGVSKVAAKKRGHRKGFLPTHKHGVPLLRTTVYAYVLPTGRGRETHTSNLKRTRVETSGD